MTLPICQLFSVRNSPLWDFFLDRAINSVGVQEYILVHQSINVFSVLKPAASAQSRSVYSVGFVTARFSATSRRTRLRYWWKEIPVSLKKSAKIMFLKAGFLSNIWNSDLFWVMYSHIFNNIFPEGAALALRLFRRKAGAVEQINNIQNFLLHI